MVVVITELDAFKKALKNAGDKLVVVDFTASWCGPCKQIGPHFDSLSKDSAYKNVVFLKVDVEDAEDVARYCDINCMPTFHFYKNEDRIDEFSGANKEELVQRLNRHK